MDRILKAKNVATVAIVVAICTIAYIFRPDASEVDAGRWYSIVPPLLAVSLAIVTGRIFVGNDAQFEGYTGGGTKEMIEGLMSIGDLGHFDKNGLLFVEGRDDDMIISGGENVFPSEVEDLLSDHPSVQEAAVIGVPDEEFGQRLKAFVVLRDGAEFAQTDAKNYVKSHLARHKVPREVVFLSELPRNPTGKVLKRVLREMN